MAVEWAGEYLVFRVGLAPEEGGGLKLNRRGSGERRAEQSGQLQVGPRVGGLTLYPEGKGEPRKELGDVEMKK